VAYSEEADTGFHAWEMNFTHSSGVKFMLCILNTSASIGDSVPMESTKDQLFQALVNKIDEFPNVVIDKATKTTSYTSECKPATK
jgi:biotin-(acetyl-CoA carboxylase) ligase